MESIRKEKIDKLMESIRNSSATPNEKIDILEALSELIIWLYIDFDKH